MFGVHNYNINMYHTKRPSYSYTYIYIYIYIYRHLTTQIPTHHTSTHLQNRELFDDNDVPSTTSPSIQLEYDDIPALPGSMLTMPKTAYHLTWADNIQQPQTTGQHSPPCRCRDDNPAPVMSTFC